MAYKVGIVGFGWVAGAHLKSFCELEAFEPVALCSRRVLDPAALESAFGVRPAVYRDYQDFLAHPGLDVVDICTPHALHAEQGIAAARAGKHLIIEKPAALNVNDLLDLFEAVSTAGVRSSVCFEGRFLSGSRAFKSILDQGLIGELYYAEADYYHGIGPWYSQFGWNAKKALGGSSLLTAGCHVLDLLLWLTGLEASEVYSCSTRNPNPVFAPYEYDPTSVTLIRFKDSPLVAKVASVTDCLQPYLVNVHLVGSHGAIRNDRFTTRRIDGLDGWNKLEVQLADSGEVGHHPFAAQFLHFAECLDRNTDPHNSLAGTLRTHLTVLAADLSARTGQPVSLEAFPTRTV